MDFIKNFKGSKQKFEWIKIINSKLIFIIFILSALTGCGGGGGTDEINIVQPIETAAQKSMSTMNDIAKFLRLEVAQKAEAQALIASALTSSNQYVPAAGDILNFGFHNNNYNFTSQYTLDIENSTITSVESSGSGIVNLKAVTITSNNVISSSAHFFSSPYEAKTKTLQTSSV